MRAADYASIALLWDGRKYDNAFGNCKCVLLVNARSESVINGTTCDESLGNSKIMLLINARNVLPQNGIRCNNCVALQRDKER